MSRLAKLAIPLFALLVLSCVPETSIVGAPCPCPDGFECCVTTSTCIRPGGDCPATYPPSTSAACETDQDCDPAEACNSWTVVSGDLMGPKRCRVRCSSAYPCSADEVCEPTLHDGALISDMRIAELCLPSEAPEGCEDNRCSACDAADIGTVWCEGSAITSCFFALHPSCGLSCKEEAVLDCSPDDCVIDTSGPMCNESVDGPDGGPTYSFTMDCSDCQGIASPGDLACYEAGVATCWAANEWCDGCADACVLEVEACPEGATCVWDNGAHCEEI